MDAAPASALQAALPRLCGFSATLRGNLYALALKASTAGARLVEFQVAVKGFGLQTLDLRGFAMLARFLAGGACAVSMLVAVSVTPAAAHPYDQSIRGRSFFGALFGPSIARGVVSYPTNQKPGTIVVSTAQRRLYLVLGNGQALSYGIGVGKAGFAWSGVTQITDKREWPDWTPPDQMLRRRPDLPHHMAGGPDNPMGARGIYLGSSLYRIHGSNEPDSIGQAVSSGCIRLTNEDVIDLYNRVHIGATVIVQ
jgi:lipoprotein-anchoring transpeptidase ErfK/SrfK